MKDAATGAEVVPGVGYNDREAEERTALDRVAALASALAPSLHFQGRQTWADANWLVEARCGDRPGRALLTVHRRRPDDEGAAAAHDEPHVLLYRVTFQDPLRGTDDGDARFAPHPADAAALLQDWASLPDEPFRRALLAPPLNLGDMERLRTLAGARRAACLRADSLVIADAPYRDGGDPPGWFEEARRLLAGNFPRDPDGLLTLGQVVALAPRDAEQPCGERGLWYVAEGPRLRRDPQTIRLSWQSRVGENHTHRWDETPWLWDPDAAARATDAHRWGVDGLPLAVLGFSPDGAVPPEADNATPAGRVARTLRLQDFGSLVEALALWGVEPSGRVLDLLAGVEARQERDHSEVVREAVRRAALWRWPDLVARETARLEAWRRERRGRTTKPAALKLFFLPHETGASRAALFLGAQQDGSGIRLYVDRTSYEARLAASLWLRPLDLDLRRFGLE